MITKNETILIQWDECLFSEHVYAWFEYGMTPVFASRLEDLMLPDDYVVQTNESSGSYEVFGWDEDASEHLYTGRLFTPKGKPLEEE